MQLARLAEDEQQVGKLCAAAYWWRRSTTLSTTEYVAATTHIQAARPTAWRKKSQ